MERHDSRSSEGPTRTSMTFGRNRINLHLVDASRENWSTADVPSADSADLCFLTEADPNAVVEHSRRCGVGIVAGPVTKQGALGPIPAVPGRNAVRLSRQTVGTTIEWMRPPA